MVFWLCNSHLKILELFCIVQKSIRLLNRGSLNYLYSVFLFGMFFKQLFDPKCLCLITFQSIEYSNSISWYNKEIAVIKKLHVLNKRKVTVEFSLITRKAIIIFLLLHRSRCSKVFKEILKSLKKSLMEKKVTKRALKDDSFLEISCVISCKTQPSGSVFKLYYSKILWQFQEEDWWYFPNFSFCAGFFWTAASNIRLKN